MLGFACLSPAAAQALPDPRLTPGAAATTDRAVICAPGHARSMRLYDTDRQAYWALTDAVAAAYRVGDRHAVEFDHLIPLCLGGANSIANLWPEPIAEARRKDRIEALVCRDACAGNISIEAAQRFFGSGAWARGIVGAGR